MTQEVLLVIPGTEGELEGQRALIEADTTAADLLRAAKLNPDQYQLQRKQGEQLVSLESQERVAKHVSAGDKVFAFPAGMTVGRAI